MGPLSAIWQTGVTVLSFDIKIPMISVAKFNRLIYCVRVS